jgi:hypothetical protein
MQNKRIVSRASLNQWTRVILYNDDTVVINQGANRLTLSSLDADRLGILLSNRKPEDGKPQDIA